MNGPLRPELPSWCDLELSRSLAVIRDRGEGQEIEFKVEFPQSGRDLAKEIAAFASSGGGMIIIGVSDRCELVGISGAETQSGRDELLERVAGLCRGAVKPAITPAVSFAVEGGKVVMAIAVPSGSEPVYYASDIPYIRHLTSSRPAEPHEVIRLVLAHYGTPPPEEAASREWVRRLVEALVPVLVLGDEADQRMAEPWFGMWRAQFKQSAEQLRELLAEDSVPMPHENEVRHLVSLLDEVANLRMTMGCAPRVSALVKEATRTADGVWTALIGGLQLGFGGKNAARPLVHKAIRKLDDLAKRARVLLFTGSADEFQAGVAEAGLDLLRASIIYLRSETPTLASELRDIGRQLHLVEAERLYMDGGQSQLRLMAQVGRLRDMLLDLASNAFP